MDRRLIIMRHAQSDAGNLATADHDRGLTDQGRIQAHQIADQLVTLGWVPQQVLSSDARRTRQTFEEMATRLQPPPAVIYDEDLYLSGVDAFQQALFAVDDAITDVLLLAHNPGCQQGITYFSGRSTRMGTACAALLHCDSDDWSDAAQSGRFSFVQLLRP